MKFEEDALLENMLLKLSSVELSIFYIEYWEVSLELFVFFTVYPNILPENKSALLRDTYYVTALEFIFSELANTV